MKATWQIDLVFLLYGVSIISNALHIGEAKLASAVKPWIFSKGIRGYKEASNLFVADAWVLVEWFFEATLDVPSHSCQRILPAEPGVYSVQS